MEYKYLGRTGLKVSRLCLGTMNFGPNTDETEAFAIMDRALEAGIQFFDTANMYGERNGGYRGWTEDIIGRWFAQGGGRRDKIVLASKVFADMKDPADGPCGGAGLSAHKIRRHLDGCLRRLRTDRLELLYLHEYDPHASWDELWEVLSALTAQGKIFYTGASNFSAWQLVQAQEAAGRHHALGLTCLQYKYNLLRRLPELELAPMCRYLGLGITTYSPLHMGLLSGSLEQPIDRNQRSAKFAGSLDPDLKNRLDCYFRLCRDLGESPSSVALSWLLSRPDITSPVIGPRTLEQLNNALYAEQLSLPGDFLEALDRLFPGLCKEGPEAYR